MLYTFIWVTFGDHKYPSTHIYPEVFSDIKEAIQDMNTQVDSENGYYKIISHSQKTAFIYSENKELIAVYNVIEIPKMEGQIV